MSRGADALVARTIRSITNATNHYDVLGIDEDASGSSHGSGNASVRDSTSSSSKACDDISFVGLLLRCPVPFTYYAPYR